MSSFSLLAEKNRTRKPVAWPTETPKWGDAPSFSFDYYDHGTNRKPGTLSNLHDFETKEKSGLKPVQHFIPDSWKRFLRKGRAKGECFTMKNVEDVHDLPSISSLKDVSRESSLGDKSGDFTEFSSISNKTVQEIKQTKPPDSTERKSQLSTIYGEKRSTKPKRIVFQDEVQQLGDVKRKVTKAIYFSEKGSDTGALSRSIPTGYQPKPYVVPDYVVKYPEIKSAEERDNYKAVFNDQYAEYKELYSEVRSALLKFKELDTMMKKLTSGSQSQEASDRIKAITEKYEKKKNDPAFIEKRERCIYLKGKLSHIKKQIQAYDQHEGSVYF
ncbi:occludin/ELL domain-containing protein 1 isoform X2 [Bufo bufo]|uniref:occludin/ELL domain-containing protein 1 isoform X2 n=1 Tax=Bufo bufo TaxID=8384 RepID=UPI001ABDF3A1|nr:occludin/ELL domain-containing protein 1 isoform X2 [Bufo bufo]